MSRANIDLDDSSLEIVMHRYHLRTKTEAVTYAHRALAGQPMTREEILAREGARLCDAVPQDRDP